MNCIKCSHNNPGTVVYCQKCGSKLDLTADEIRDSFLAKAKGDAAAATEDAGKQLLFFAGVVLLIAITCLVAVGSVPEGRRFVPSAASDSEYVKVGYKYEPKGEMQLVPYKAKRN